jgi:hypothetical protein
VVIVAAAALIAAGTAVGVTLATRTHLPKEAASTAPPLVTDPTAPASVVSEVREALRAWPNGTVRRLRILAAQHPSSGLVRLELGLALVLTNQPGQAEAAWRQAKKVEPDSVSAVRADDLLHPDTPRGEPPFVPNFVTPRTRVQRLLAEGVELQRAYRPVSAEHVFAEAARLAPNDPEARVAAAVGLYDKDRPQIAFSQLGPLARRFPRSQSVRFHLGLLLIYFRQIAQARTQLALAAEEGRTTPDGRAALELLKASRKR